MSLSDKATVSTSTHSSQKSRAVPQKTYTSTTPQQRGREEEVDAESSIDELSSTRNQYSSTDESDSSTEMLIDSVRRTNQSFAKQAGPSQPKRATPSTPKSTNIKRKSILEVFLPIGLKIENVKATTAELVWTLPNNKANPINLIICVRYWLNGQNGSSARKLDFDSTYTGCLLKNLIPGSMYLTNIFIFSEDEHHCMSSNSIEFTTLDKDIRAAEAIKNRSQQIVTQHGLELYAVPLKKTTKSGAKFDRFVFGKPYYYPSRRQHKTILLMGVTGSGKTTLINAMMNYVLNIKRDDPFRFQLIQKRKTKNNRIAIYDINSDDQFKIPLSFTIVDTPSFTENQEKNEPIIEMIRELVQNQEDDDSIAVDMIGLVALASYPRLMKSQIQIFDAVSDIFGNKAADHTHFLLTFSDGTHLPRMLEFLSDHQYPIPTGTTSPDPYNYNKFNCSGFFDKIDQNSTAGKYNQNFWNMSVENFNHFFNFLKMMNPI